jgi:7-keto-8-aminopelargonate synthetase-like enzyme
MLRFNHNNTEDLERVLSNCDGSGGKLVIVDGVFSMDGDIADLPAIVRVSERYGAHVMVDDAHGLGVMGPNGTGTSAHFGLNDRVALIMGTFSKSFASIGGFVAGDETVMNYIRHHARSLIFSASLPPAQVASVLAALEILQSEPDRLERLWENTRYLREGLDGLGFDTGCSETPIIPVMIGDDMRCFQTWLALREEGIFVNPIISPAVSSDQALIRVSIMATHTREHLDRGLEIFAKVGKKLGLI